jgi:CheY-like chemotaxis protein
MSKRILVVDDEVALTRMVKMNLESAGDFNVRTVNRGSEAIAAAREFRPDMIFLDVMMPDMSGDEVALELREDPELSSIPMVFMTAIVTKSETGSTGANIGGNVFLAKPVKSSELLAVIDKMTG